jgi:hypothetical protein
MPVEDRMGEGLDRGFYIDQELGLDLQLPLQPQDELLLQLDKFSMEKKRVGGEDTETTLDESMGEEDRKEDEGNGEVYFTLFSELSTRICKCGNMYDKSKFDQHKANCKKWLPRKLNCSKCSETSSGRTELVNHINKNHKRHISVGVSEGRVTKNSLMLKRSQKENKRPSAWTDSFGRT